MNRKPYSPMIRNVYGSFFILFLIATVARANDTKLNAWMMSLAGDTQTLQSTSPATAEDIMDAKQHLRLMARDTVPESLRMLRIDAPKRLSATDYSEVWSAAAQDYSGGYSLAMRHQGNAWHPLYLTITGLPSQTSSTFDDAYKRVRSFVLGPNPDNIEVKALHTPILNESGELKTWRDKPVDIPWDAAWVFMIDDDPLANWEHPCRYVFLSEDLSSIAVQYALTPLSIDSETTTQAVDSPNEFEVVIPFTPPVFPHHSDARVTAPNPFRYSSPVSNCYAIIISGGYNKQNNHIRYWGDVSYIYSTLSLKYGYPKTNIYTLVSDGLNPAIDTSSDTSSPFDLDGDGRDDTIASATAGNISNMFSYLQTKLTTNDQLLVFTTDHGGPTEGGGEWDVELNLWNMEVLRDIDMKHMTESFVCPVYFVMEQCYGGGFLDDLNQSNRMISTAARYNESSYAGSTYPWFNQWAYHWTAAMRGFYPQTNAPWIDAEPCDGDLNDDGAVSFEEANQYAFTHKYANDHPMYASYPGDLGKISFLSSVAREELGLGELNFGSTPSLFVSNTPTPLRITAQNVFGDIITNYTGPATLHAEASPIDPGTYVGNGTSESAFPLNTTYMDSRVQIIYPPDVMGAARTLTNIQLHVIQPPSLTMSNLTIRLKHTALTFFPDNPVWETENWSTVYVSNLLLTTTGWVTFAFTTPFDYNGTDSLMMDFSLHNDSYDDGGQFSVTYTSNHAAIGYLSDNEDGDPLTWSNNIPAPTLSPAFANLRFGPPPIPVSVQITPTNLTGFVNGIWTGTVSVMNTADDVCLCVADSTNDAWNGTSTPFSITDTCQTNYVDVNGSNPSYPYASWETAATTLQTALNAAEEGNTVFVTNGYYSENGAFYAGMTNRAIIGTGIVMRSINGPAVTHIIGAEDSASGSEHGLGPAAIRGVALLQNATLSGFTIRNGRTTTNGFGGGIFAESATIISNCIIRDNIALNGGGLYATADTRIVTCLLLSNACKNSGGGLYMNGTGHIASCTIFTNSAGYSGGGIYLASKSDIAMSIIYGNQSYFNGENLFDVSGLSTIEYCCTVPDPGGTGNVTGDPAFAASDTNDFRLANGSPCIDTGPDGAPASLDLSGILRPLDGLGTSIPVIDIGAYEYFYNDGDTDADGMRDGWEKVHGLDLYNPADAAQNPDGDPADNVSEALADTDPFNRESYLRIDNLLFQPQLVLYFQPASTNRAYTVRSSDNLTAGNWTNLSGATHIIPSSPGVQSILLQDPPPSNAPIYYYRLKVDYP